MIFFGGDADFSPVRYFFFLLLILPLTHLRPPQSPSRQSSSRYVLNGFGLFTEGYTLFSIGNLTPLFKAVWPDCWSTHRTCDKNWIAAVSPSHARFRGR